MRLLTKALPVEAICCSAKGSLWNGSPRIEERETFSFTVEKTLALSKWESREGHWLRQFLVARM